MIAGYLPLMFNADGIEIKSIGGCVYYDPVLFRKLINEVIEKNPKTYEHTKDLYKNLKPDDLLLRYTTKHPDADS